MASRSLGTLTLDLVAKIGGYTAGLDKAEREAKKRAQAIEKVWDGAGAALKNFAIIGVAAATATALAFDRLIKGAANFKDLEEMTGASAEGLASMAVAADVAGVSMETIAGNAIKLTKNLTGVDDESKAAGAAIKALGLNLEDFKKLDPVGQTDALTKAFGSFADGSEKSAVAVALWGKSGAEMLKVLKALEEQGGRTTILTQQQIELADAYADAQSKTTAELKLYAQAASTEALPAFNALSTAAKELIAEIIGIDKETGKLAANAAVKDFAEGTAKAFGLVIDAGQVVSRVFEGIGHAIGALAAASVAVAKLEFRQALAILDELDRKNAEITKRGFFSDRLAAALGATPSAPGAAPGRPRLNFGGAVTGAGAGGKKGRDERLEAAKTQQKQYFDWIDAQYEEAIDEGKAFLEADIKQSKEAADAKKLQMEQYFDWIDQQQQDAIDEGKAFLDAQVKQADTFALRFAENVQDVLGQGLYDAMTGNFKNIGDAFAQMINRMVAEAAAAQLSRYLFGDLIKGGEGGGVVGSLFKSLIGGAFAGGGSPPVGRVSLVGENGPELFVPRTAGTIVPAGQTARAMGGQTVHQTFVVQPGTSRDTQEQFASAARRGLMRAGARGTA